ncbi:MAG TPA: hypothetical protein VN622_11095 [Clostridia bacterium]|nr:hypothetical protein [Clostridia bacterium]
MKYLVDAGEIVSVNGVSPRDSVHLALTALGDRARFPVTVHELGTGKAYLFVEHAEYVQVDPGDPLPVGEKKTPGRVSRDAYERVRA